MVHHNEWDRKLNEKNGYMQKDHDEMEEIVKEMAPGGNHYHAFKDGSVGSVKSDSNNLNERTSVHRGKYYDHSLPSFYHGKWSNPNPNQSSDSVMMSVIKVFAFLLVASFALKCLMMVTKSSKKRSSRSKSRSRSR